MINTRLNRTITGTCTLLLPVFILIASTLVSFNSHAYESVDKIIAVINEDVIFSSDYERAISQAKIRLQSQKRQLNDKQLQERVLNKLILDSLQLEIAERNKIEVSEEEINKTIEQTQQGLLKQGIQFTDYLKSQNLTLETARKEIKRELAVSKIQQGVIKQRANVTAREIDNFLESTQGQEWLKPKLHLAHILLPATESEKPKVLKQAQKMYVALKKPKNSFQRAAQLYSKGGNASKGGDLGLRKYEDLPSLFVEQAKDLNPGEITPPFASNAGIHLLKVLNKQGSEAVLVKQHKVRHVLLKTSELFTEAEAEIKIKSLYQRLKSGENFALLAEENTDDVATKSSGGELGWSTPGQFVPEFEQEMNNTATGKISAPFKTQFGWHILKVDDIRTKDFNEEVKRNQVANILRQQRFSDELQIWLKELRDNAYVEILI